jgi:hypothetical protein
VLTLPSDKYAAFKSGEANVPIRAPGATGTPHKMYTDVGHFLQDAAGLALTVEIPAFATHDAFTSKNNLNCRPAPRGKTKA